ncbi:MAG: hypothetical protein D6820_10650 [Lentisphaerae bacterium]|nr:MAG: hypothetical protein D6820_10650 [Lentisphaerota bacterium]
MANPRPMLGRPLSPDLLLEEGFIDRIPGDITKGSGEPVTRFEILTCYGYSAQDNSSSHPGSVLAIQQEEENTYRITEERFLNQMHVRRNSQLVTAEDGTLRSFTQKTAFFLDGHEERSLSELAYSGTTLPDGTFLIKAGDRPFWRLPAGQPVYASWTLLLDGALLLRIAETKQAICILEDLVSPRVDQHLRRAPELGTSRTRDYGLHCILRTGRGAPPVEYWLDAHQQVWGMIGFDIMLMREDVFDPEKNGEN